MGNLPPGCWSLWNKLPRSLQWFIAVCYLTGIWLAILWGTRVHLERYEFYNQLMSDGAATTGIVTRAGGVNTRVEYDFTAIDSSGTPVIIHAAERINIELLFAQNAGDVVSLHYDPADPSVSRLDSNPYLLIGLDSIPNILAFILVTLLNLIWIAAGARWIYQKLRKLIAALTPAKS